MIQKYIIEKTDIHDLLTGQEISLSQGKARAFCVEIVGEITNGDVIQAMFPNEELYEQGKACTYYGMMRFDTDWWNLPYKGSDKK